MSAIFTRFAFPLVAAVLLCVGCAHAADGTTPKLPQTPAGTPHDLDALLGRWHTSVRRLLKPLQGSNDWAEYEGTGDVTPLLGGKANVAELDVAGPRGRIQGISVRLFDTQAQRWTFQFTSIASGVLDAGIAGGFAGGRHGEFYGLDTFNGKPIIVRFIIDVIDPAHIHFEQAFSPDGGATWELNWIADDRRR
jgi:hypothetical protein